MTESDNVDFILEEFLPYQLNVIAQLISESFAKTYTEAFDISVPEWRVIAHLSQQQDISIREISEHAFMPKAKVTRAVQILVARKLVKKVTDTDDRRLVSLQLTRKGRKLFNEIAPMAKEFEANILSNLPKNMRSNATQFVSALLGAAKSPGLSSRA